MKQSTEKPSMFGLQRSNKDFTKPENWGKNIFNNAFPASLLCYLHTTEQRPIYLMLNNLGKVAHQHIDVESVFGIDPTSESTFFVFENDYSISRSCFWHPSQNRFGDDEYRNRGIEQNFRD